MSVSVPRSLPAILIASILTGGAVGMLFGDRNLTSHTESTVMQTAALVELIQEWSPETEEADQLVYDGIDGLLTTLDPHSNFLRPRNYQDMRERQDGSFFGVGIIISRRGGRVTVIAPIAGTPAASKGLRPGDVIVAIDGEDSTDMGIDDVVERVRGPEGTPIELNIRRPGMDETFAVEMNRARIPTNSVRYAFMIRPQVGYVRLSEFSNTSVREVSESIDRLQAEGMQSLIFDLRDNPGGPLDAAVGVSDVFLHEGQLIVSTQGRAEDSNQRFTAPGRGTRFEGPLVVLVNPGSASASEIVAGAVQDHDRGIIVGEVTWGKGLVQTVYPIQDAGLALTTAHYFTPSGRFIQRDYDSYIDYITHRGGGEETSDNGSYSTDSGRTVLGGGGITPDVVEEARLLHESLPPLFGRSAFFRFAVSELEGLDGEQASELARDYAVDETVLARFFDLVRAEELLDDEGLAGIEDDEQAMSDLALAIRTELANSGIDLEAGYRTSIEGDNQMQQALGQLEDADRLWTEFQQQDS